MEEKNPCPSIYQEFFSNPLFVEQFILIIYSLIFLVGLVGNIMTIVIINCKAQLRTPTNFYLLNLAVSDLMMLMCNLPLEMLEIYHRQWPLSIIFCKLRNICAEFFTCSSILTILAFTCERYFAIVHPLHLHRLSHFRRAQNIIIIIWIISLGFSLPLGLSYEIEFDSSVTLTNKTQSHDCKSCVPKRSLAEILSVVIIISSLCLFFLPMFIIGAIYLFIGKALRRVTKYEGHSTPPELSSSSRSSKEAIEMKRHGSHVNSYSWLKMRARCQARQVVVKTLVAVVIAFFVCYAPMYFQRLLLAITNLNSTSNWSFLSNFMAYLYVISGVTFYFGSVINPILYNVVSNKYRRAFRDLFCCRLKTKQRKFNPNPNENFFPANHLHINYGTKQATYPKITLKINKMTAYSSIKSSEKNKRLVSHQ